MIGLRKLHIKKAESFCLVLIIVSAIVFFLAGKWQTGIYTKLKKSCTAQVFGTVVNESKDRGVLKSRASAENKYLTSKYWRHIEVETDGVFRLRHIYTNVGAEHKGDRIVIHYDPNDPDNYYPGDKADDYKTAAVFAYGASGLMIVTALFLLKRFYKRSELSNEGADK